MDDVKVPQGGFGKRKTLDEKLNDLEALSGEEGERDRTKLLSELEQDVAAADWTYLDPEKKMCPTCKEDPAVDEELQRKEYGSQKMFDDHIKDQHSGEGLAITTTPMRTLLTPEPVLGTGSAILRGSNPMPPLHPRYNGLITSSNTVPRLSDSSTIPPHLQGMIKSGHDPSLGEIPDYLEGVIVRHVKPTSGEKLEEDKEEDEG